MAIIEIKGLRKEFGSFTAVKDMSFSVSQGEVVALLGANGAGKTTSMRMLTGYFKPTKGSIRLGDVDVVRYPRVAQALIGYLPETPPLYPEMTVRSYLEYVAHIRGAGWRLARLQVAQAMERCWLEDRASWVISQLSRGYRQRVGLAQAILADPQVLVLDEPTSGLDPEQILMVRDLVTELARDRTVLFSTHILAEAEKVCNRAIILKKGDVLADETIPALLAPRGPVEDVYMSIRGERHAVIAVLNGVPGVNSVALASPGGTDPWVRVKVTAKRSSMLLSDLGRAVIDRGMALGQIEYRRNTLEEVYLKLVGHHEAKQAA